MKAHVGRVSAALALAVAIAIPASAAGHSGAAVALRHISFSPSSLTIKRGTYVTFVWEDGSIPHNVTGPGVHTATKTSGSYTVRFTHRGTFTYRCTLHPFMKVRITVR